MPRGLKSWHPLVVLFYYASLMVWFILISQPVFLLLSLLCLGVLHLILDDGKKLREWRWSFLVMGLFFFFGTLIFNQRGQEVLFYLFNRPIVLESVFLALQISLSFLNISFLGLSLDRLFPPSKFLYLLRKVSHKWALILMVSLAFIPRLKEKMVEMIQAQKQKEKINEKENWKKTMQRGIQLLKMLLLSSLEDSILLADSMTSRGYTDNKRTYYQDSSLSNQDKLIIMAMILLNLGLVRAYRHGFMTQVLSPSIEPLFGLPNQWFYLLVWSILVSLPIISEGKELAKWHFSKSKI